MSQSTQPRLRPHDDPPPAFTGDWTVPPADLVVQYRYAQPTPGTRYTMATLYAPPSLTRVVRDLLATMAHPGRLPSSADPHWRNVEAVAGVGKDHDGHVAIRRRDGAQPILAWIWIASEHPPLSVEAVGHAIAATRFGGPQGWTENTDHLAKTLKGEFTQ